MRKGELDCIHGIGHSANNHGCDGCCFVLGVYERERIIKLLEEEADICYGLGFNPGKRLLDVIIDRIKGENK